MLSLFKENKMFRTYLLYRVFSGLGGGIFAMFMLLSIHMIYGNPIYTGIAGFLMAAPQVFSFAVGPVVDRRNKVIIARFTTFLEFLVLVLVAFTPLVEQLGVMFMFAVIFVYAVTIVFEGPAGNALLPQIVHKDKLMEANSLVYIASLIGGIAIGLFLFLALGGGDANVQFLYGISAGFTGLAFVFTLFLKDPTPKQSPNIQTNYIHDLKEGVRFIRHNVLMFLVIAVVVKWFVIRIASVNTPMFADYHVGVQGYVVFALVGMAGGLVASYVMGVFGKRFKVGMLLFMMYILAGLTEIVFVLTLPHAYAFALGMLFLNSAFVDCTGIAYGTLEQKIPPKDMVGRVDTLTTTFVALAAMIGALIGGFLGSVVPIVDHIFIYLGISYVVIGVLLISVPSIRKLPKINDLQENVTQQ